MWRMTNPFRHVCGAVGAVALLAIAGPGGCGGGGGATGGTCATGSGSGTLSIRITGTPSGLGLVTVGGQNVTSDTDLTPTAGPQDVKAFLVAEGGTIVRTAYTPTIDVASPCVHAGQTTTVNVTYAAIATSGKLWTGVSDASSSATLLGYAPATVAATGTASAAVAANTSGSGGFTFDQLGNVWVTGATTVDPPVARYSASMFNAGGDKTPEISLSSPSFGSAIPGPGVLALDPSGNLWVSVVGANKVVEFTVAQLSATNPTAAVERTGITSPSGIAFDTSGNMWVATGDDTVVRIDAAHLATSGASADCTITAQSPAPVVLALSAPQGIAFDANGNLWVSYDQILAALSPADLAGTGAKTVTPAIQIGTNVLGLPTGIAFDEEGGLWLAAAAGKFARFSQAQLAASGSPAPDIVITSPDLGYAGWFAIYPAPAFSPLEHGLP